MIFRCFCDFKIFRKSLEILGSIWKYSEIFRKFQKRFKSNFQMFLRFLKFLENLQKSSEVFRNTRKFLDNFGNSSKVIFRCFYDFLKFLENLRKCSEIFDDIFSSEDMENILAEPGYTVIWILWMVYFIIKHGCPYNKTVYQSVWSSTKSHWLAITIILFPLTRDCGPYTVQSW